MLVLRVDGTRSVWAKAHESPVLMHLILEEPLSEEQLRHLTMASPWNPIPVEGRVGPWLQDGFAATIDEISVLQPPRPPKRPRRPCPMRP